MSTELAGLGQSGAPRGTGSDTTFDHVTYGWDPAVADALDPVDRLVYRSNLLGSDQRVTNTGGGNTSSKLTMQDPLGRGSVQVLWVKGSGGDLRTAKREHFASLLMPELERIRELYLADPQRGPKSEAEDRTVAQYPHATFDLNPRASSIDTPLHAFVPYKHVDHTHPNAIIAIAAAKDGERLTREIFGDEVAWLPWQRPGFDLGLRLRQVIEERPGITGVILGQHGLINWADDDHECYLTGLRLIEQAAEAIEAADRGAATFGGQRYAPLEPARQEELLAAVLPRLRGMVSTSRRMIGTVQSDGPVLRFVNSVDAARLAELGTSCPDHFLRTKIKPLYVDWDPHTGTLTTLIEALERGVARYRGDYAAYYQRCKRDGSPAMRDPNPTVVLIPGLGMIAWGKDKSESRVTAEFYNAAVEVMRGAEALDEYVSLPQQEAFDIEYWALEEAKLRRMPPAPELGGKVAVVIGAGSGIGKAVAARVATGGAAVVCADLHGDQAAAVAESLEAKLGAGIGVAGTGLSAKGPAIALPVDITDEQSVRAMVREVVLAYGGIDAIIVTAGVFIAPDASGHAPANYWSLSFAVNVTGSYLVATAARDVWEAQGLNGAMVLTTSVNGTVAGKGSVAYDTSKAAANHLVRELAVTFAPLVRVNGLAPATVVEGSAMFGRERVIASLSKYGIAFEQDESTDDLRTKLADFYAQRTLTRQPITLADQAEVAYLLVTDRFSKTTGQIINVDGGRSDAFLR